MRCPPQVMRCKAMMRKSISSCVETSSREQWSPPVPRSSRAAVKNSHHEVLSAAQKDTVLRGGVSNFSGRTGGSKKAKHELSAVTVRSRAQHSRRGGRGPTWPCQRQRRGRSQRPHAQCHTLSPAGVALRAAGRPARPARTYEGGRP